MADDALRASVVAARAALDALASEPDADVALWDADVTDAASNVLSAEQRVRACRQDFEREHAVSVVPRRVFVPGRLDTSVYDPPLSDELTQLGVDARQLEQECFYQRSVLRASPDVMVGYASNVPGCLTVAQIRVAAERAEATNHERWFDIRRTLQARVPLSEAVEFLDHDQARVVCRPLGEDHWEEFSGAVADRLREALAEHESSGLLGQAIALAEKYLRLPGVRPEGFQGFSAADLLVARGGDGWDKYDPASDDIYIPVANALTAARLRKAEQAVEYDEGEGEEKRRAERRAVGLPEDLPERPKEHTCPISYERMLDPVVAADGLSYERSAFENWIQRGNLRSPSTSADLPTDETCDNLNLRKLIREYAQTEHDKIMRLARQLVPPAANAAAAADARATAGAGAKRPLDGDAE
jgi:hypothetical protein